MHRSGTSLMARLVNLLGIHLGAADRLIPPTKSNPRGFWEHRLLTDLSEEVLATMGGSWHEPPDLPLGWERDSLLLDLRQRAKQALEEEFAAREDWGWKDPWLALTLPFWLQLVPTPRYVVCFRNPVDVADSIVEVHSSRKWSSFEDGVDLWVQYTAKALEHTAGSPRILVAYEDVISDPEAELRRVASFLERPHSGEDPEARKAMHAEVDKELWRHRTDRKEVLNDPRLPPPAAALFVVLRRYLDLTRNEEATEPLPLGALERIAAACQEARGRPPAPVRAPRATPAAPSGPRASAAGLRTSVALCTYRGTRYLRELLDSLAGQTRPPDEVVVCDDRSSDGTVGLLEEFRARVPFPVEIRVNDRRVGSTKNFEQAMGLCSGDLILLCDQDDVWHADKMAKLNELFETRPSLGAAFTNAELIDESSRTLAGTLWGALGITSRMHRRFSRLDPAGRVAMLLPANLATGATMAVRARFRDLLLPIPSDWVQDAWIAILISAVADVAMLDEPLITYRLHGGQQIGVGVQPMNRLGHLRRKARFMHRARRDDRHGMRGLSRAFLQCYSRLSHHRDRYPCPEEVLRLFEAKIRHFRTRGQMDWTHRRVRAVTRELLSGRYHRYSNGIASAAKDLLLFDRS
jgi:glycosyltransferase involved in cell wall biosynthesis